MTYYRPVVAGRPVRVAPRPAFLAGREDLLASLHARLSDGGGAGPRVVALHGLGGAGKTSVAVEYAHRRLGDGLGLVWQVPAEDPSSMAAELGELAAVAGARDLLDARDPVAVVHAMLADRPGGWLLIFDNAPDAASVAGVLPPAGDGQVIITTRSAHWPRNQAVEIPVLDAETAAEFLADRTGDGDQVAALALAEELGGLPLALEQAAAYITAVGQDLAGYLAAYRDRAADLLDRGDPAGYDQRVTTTWNLSFTALQASAPAAAGLLRLLACCAPDAIPYRLLLQPATPPAALPPGPGAALTPLLADALAADDAVAALRRYSLISAPAGGTVSVHRLVQAITVARLPGEQAAAWQQAAAALITAALPPDPQQPAAWPAFAALLSHVLVALPLASEPPHLAAAYLGRSGNYTAACDLHQQILTARQHHLGAEHPETLTARGGLAHWTGQAGDPAGARDQFAALLPVSERILGAEHPETLTARANLANLTGRTGDPAGARDQYATLLPVSERILGAEHPDTLAARASLARWTGLAGDPAGARDQIAGLLPVFERVSGAEHPGTLATRSNLAAWTGEAGNPAGARDQYAALLPVIERVLGAEHPDTLAACANLAYLTGVAGDPVGARDQYAALLPVRERVSGAEHPSTVTARTNLARWTRQADKSRRRR